MNQSMRYPSALTIAGSDSGGGAGIQADLKTFAALGVYGASAITAITAQNTLGVTGIQAITPTLLAAQIDAVMSDIKIDAIKIGMLHNAEAVQIVADAIDRYKPRFVVLDPVMISTSGAHLIEALAIEKIQTLLFPRATLLTPNIHEATFLTGIAIQSSNDMEKAAHALLNSGCQNVLMKGGHLVDEDMIDILFTPNSAGKRFCGASIDTQNTHGTGCTLSSAIAAKLTLGHTLEEAVSLAKTYITEALIAGAKVKVGAGHGPVNHSFAPIPLQMITIE